MMFTRRVLFLLGATLTLSVQSENITFKKVKVKYFINGDESFTVINSSDSIKKELETAPTTTRIEVLEGSTIPILYENAFSDLPNLKGLDIIRRGIEEIHPGAFANVPHLEDLRLSGNKLKVIENGVFSNLNIAFLELDENLIERVSPQAFENMPNLKVLDFTRNKIKEIHAEWLKGKPSLESFSCGFNQIEELPRGIFTNYHNDAHFNHNKIKSVSRDIFGADDKIVFGQLWLGNNEIEKWAEGFVRGAEFRFIDFANNKLQCLEGKYEHFFVALQTRIDGNPWNCECLLQIAKWVAPQQEVHDVDMIKSAQKCNSTGQFPTLLY